MRRTLRSTPHLPMTLAVLVTLALFSTQAGAQTWAIGDSFSPANPNGVWTYGYQTPLGSTLVPFATEINSGGIDCWCMSSNPDAAGNVNKNNTGSPVDMGGMWWDTAGMAMHPGPNDEKSTIRWTAPYAAIVTVDVTFFGANYATGATTDIHVRHNDSELFTGQINGYGAGGPHETSGTSPGQQFSGSFLASQGDMIDFAVGAGGNGFSYDLTGISGAITAVTGKGIVEGTVTANVPGHPALAGAVVKTADGIATATTNTYGSYQLILPAGSHTLEAAYTGAISEFASVTVAEGQSMDQDFDLTPGIGRAYYVSPSGSDTNDGKTTDSAWKTIARGDQLGILRPGDTVIVMRGTYKPADYWGVKLTNCSGTADKPIVYKAQAGVVVDQTTTPRASDGLSFGIRVEANGVVIDGFEVVGGQWGIYFNDGHSDNAAINNIIHGMRVGDPARTGFPGWCGGIGNSIATNNVNRNNLIYDIGDPAISNRATCIASPIATNMSIVNNTLLDARIGVELWVGGSRHTIVNNIIAGMRLEGISSTYASVAGFQHSNNLFHGNAANYGTDVAAGADEITADPLFVNPTARDYRLSVGSAAIDEGLEIGYQFYGDAPDVGAFEFAPQFTTPRLADLKTQADGVEVSVTEPKVVTMSSNTLVDGSYFVDEPNRVSGIRLIPARGLQPVSIGDRITFAGSMDTDATGERVVNVISITSQVSGSDISPLGMSNKAFGTGLSPCGLLVKVWGWVTYKATDGSYIYVDDGSGVGDESGRVGVRIYTGDRVIPMTTIPSVNNYAVVTGVAGRALQGSTVVRVVRPRVDSDIQAIDAMPSESQMAAQWIASNLGPNAGDRPFSFTYSGVPSSSLLPGWEQDYSVQNLDRGRNQFTITYTDPVTRLEVKCVGIHYRDFPTVEWTLYFRNTGSVDTPIIENIQSLDCVFDRKNTGEFTLHHNVGSPCTATDYMPIDTVMGPNASLRIGGAGGRPTNTDMPYFNLERPDGGVIVVIGWPGQWSSLFSRDAGNAMRIVAGQELTHLTLHPGEEIRTPLTVLQFWTGNRADSQNTWRRWMLAHNVPRQSGAIPPTIFAACSSHQYGEMINANEENQKYFISRYIEEQLGLDYWWMDAGWYINSWGWPNTGTWEVDLARFPNGLRAITDYAHGLGVKSIVWFEPERVTSGTWLTDNHPEWIIGGAGGGLLNLGNPDAWNWLVNHVDDLLVSQGIDLYRQDFNMDPLGYWRGNDAADRQGITENKHVVGYLAYWDELRRRHPDLLIDSCASGGRRNDLETMRRAIPLLRSDYLLEPVSQQNHTYGVAQWLPYWGTGVKSTNSYDFRSVMCTNIIACYDMRDPYIDYNAVRALCGQWEDTSDYLLGDYYPLTPYSADNNVWMAWQFDKPEIGQGMVQAFRRADNTQPSFTVKLNGLDPSASYRWTDLDTGGSQTYSGSQLVDSGIAITSSTRPQAKLFVYTKL